MVLLHVKRGDHDEFLHECNHQDLVADVLQTIVDLHNRRKTIEFVADNLLGLAQYGPMRPEEERGLEGTTDPSGIRVGIAPDLSAAETLQRTANDCRAAVHNRQAQARVVLSNSALDECEMSMMGAITIAYPQGLPAADVLKQYQNKGEIDVARLGNDAMEAGESALWFAGKRWSPSQRVCEYVGKNAKTKIIVRLQRLSSGAPVREPAVDNETQKAMMAYYHRKQEEQKRLAEDAQDSYLNSEWANPKQIKQAFHGLHPGDVKWRP